MQVLELHDPLALLSELLLGLALTFLSGPEDQVDERLVQLVVVLDFRLLLPPALLLQLPHSISDALLGLRVEAEEEGRGQYVWVACVVVKAVGGLPLLLHQEVVQALHEEVVVVQRQPLADVALDVLPDLLHWHSNEIGRAHV